MVRVLVVLAVLLVALSGCGQANSPTEKQEKNAGVEQAHQASEKTREPTTAQADASDRPGPPPAALRAADEATCRQRIATRGMTKKQVDRFNERFAHEMARRIEEDPDHAGDVQQRIYDDWGIPRCECPLRTRPTPNPHPRCRVSKVGEAGTPSEGRSRWARSWQPMLASTGPASGQGGHASCKAFGQNIVFLAQTLGWFGEAMRGFAAAETRLSYGSLK